MQNNKNLPYLYNDILPVTYENHKLTNFKADTSFEFAAKAQMAPIHINEIPSVVGCYPIIFVGDEKTPAAAFGLAKDQNLFINGRSSWPTDFYVPDYIRRYPFILVKNSGADDMPLCVDPSAKSLNTQEEAPNFFETTNKFTPVIEQHVDLCIHFEKSMATTRQLVSEIEDLDLFCAKTVAYTNEKNETVQTQFIGIDEKQFDSLSDSEVIALRKSGAITLIYAHLFSLANWRRLASRAVSWQAPEAE